MLVLSRQRDETIMIGDDVEITVVDIRGDKVRLGITAPTRIAVHRKEVYDAIKAENERAARLDAAPFPADAPGRAATPLPIGGRRPIPAAVKVSPIGGARERPPLSDDARRSLRTA